MERNCLSRVVDQGSRTDKQPADEDCTVVKWDANPFDSGVTSRVEPRERSTENQHLGEAATTSVEAATEQYTSMCIGTGETVA